MCLDYGRWRASGNSQVRAKTSQAHFLTQPKYVRKEIPLGTECKGPSCGTSPQIRSGRSCGHTPSTLRSAESRQRRLHRGVGGVDPLLMDETLRGVCAHATRTMPFLEASMLISHKS